VVDGDLGVVGRALVLVPLPPFAHRVGVDIDIAERLVHVPTARTAELVALVVDHVDARGREHREGAVGALIG